MTTNQNSAAATYSGRAKDIARLLDVLDMEMEAHRERAQREGATWPMAGDLGKVRGDLIEALAFLTNRTPADIEAFLVEAE